MSIARTILKKTNMFGRKILKRLLPSRYISRLLHTRNMLGNRGRISYSQFGEDLVLGKLLKKSKGFYVDVGAYHPKHFSNTYLLYQKGWRGINIDPNPETIRLFNRYRKDDNNIQTGIGARNEPLVYYTFSHSNWNTFSEERAMAWKQKREVNFLGTLTVPCRPLTKLLREQTRKDVEIDLLNIDAEGMDLEVLQSSDWEAYRPTVIVIESAAFDPDVPNSDKIYSFLKNKSYTLYAFMGTSLVFVKKK